jgi:hypothetical protein
VVAEEVEVVVVDTGAAMVTLVEVMESREAMAAVPCEVVATHREAKDHMAKATDEAVVATDIKPRPESHLIKTLAIVCRLPMIGSSPFILTSTGRKIRLKHSLSSVRQETG